MISLCLTNFNRTEFLYQSFEQVLYDDRISEIVISDDCSDDQVYQAITHKYFSIPKVKIFRNDHNLDCYRNKRQAIKHATTSWCIIFDSDNIMTPAYIDKIYSVNWQPSVILAPDFAKPHFNFTALDDKIIDRTNISSLIDVGNCSTMLNAMNYFVYRDEYLRVWDGGLDPVTSDSIYQNYRWLNAGNAIHVVPGMEYEHRIHNGSHYQQNQKRTPQGFHDDILNRLTNMR